MGGNGRWGVRTGKECLLLQLPEVPHHVGGQPAGLPFPFRCGLVAELRWRLVCEVLLFAGTRETCLEEGAHALQTLQLSPNCSLVSGTVAQCH